jgi:hypothetical protein
MRQKTVAVVARPDLHHLIRAVLAEGDCYGTRVFRIADRAVREPGNALLQIGEVVVELLRLEQVAIFERHGHGVRHDRGSQRRQGDCGEQHAFDGACLISMMICIVSPTFSSQ